MSTEALILNLFEQAGYLINKFKQAKIFCKQGVLVHVTPQLENKIALKASIILDFI